MGEKIVKEIMEAETVLVENGIEYYEDNGLYYPKLVLEDSLGEENLRIGRWGNEWISYMKNMDKPRYWKMIRSGQIRKIAHEVDLEAGKMISRIERNYYEKHKAKGNEFWQNYKVRQQGRAIAEEIVRKEVIQVCR